MKFENNFTTIEQSKKLLELGVPEWTADMFYKTWTSEIVYDVNSEKKEVFPEIIPFNTTYRKYLAYGENFDVFKHEYFYPCWTVGRLIEIMNICSIHNIVSIYRTDRDVTQIDIIIETIINRINGNSIDFLKLEEEQNI
jgi:hypothetical protein